MNTVIVRVKLFPVNTEVENHISAILSSIETNKQKIWQVMVTGVLRNEHYMFSVTLLYINPISCNNNIKRKLT